jgi:1-acyl-sn-glycerol-3-phosphate acyltransferase
VLPVRARLGLRVQEVLSQALILVTYYGFVGWLRYRRYRIPDLSRLRAEFAALERDCRGPLLVCANHITLVDSLVIQWALAPGWRLMVRPRWFIWNLPDRHNISATWWLRTIGYLGKCVPVLREGPPEEARRTLDKVAFLLARGQSVLVFPEGGRSRIGRVDPDRVMYGVGRMLQQSPGAHVLCVYARGVGQGDVSNYPRTGERFFVRLSAFAPATAHHGLRADRDLAMQIVGRLIEMEQEYFAHANLDR